MPAVARLTWQAADPAALAASLADRLGVAPVPDRDRQAVPLATAVLELVAWQPEQPGDRPLPGGRLVFEPAWDDVERTFVVAQADDAFRLLGVAWCTVELGRAERDLEMWLDAVSGDDPRPGDVPDALLGAVSRTRRAHQLPGGRLVLVEPATEGRVAASLARDAEGPCGLYVTPTAGFAAWRSAARARGRTLSRRAPGPFGDQVLVLGGPVAGPHLLVVDGVAR